MSRHLIPIHRRNIISEPFSFLRQEIDKIFDTNTSALGITPEFEIKENKDGLSVTAELPGVSEKDINVTLENGVLTISGEKKSEETKEGETYYIAERTYGSFSRSIRLPYEPDEKKTSATFSNGVLKLAIPRSQTSKTHTHRIEVQKK
jgi:HSP20 family protein